MTTSSTSPSLLIMVAGAKGAIATTLAAAVSALQRQPDMVQPFLMTANRFNRIGPLENTVMAGWDVQSAGLKSAAFRQGVLPSELCGLLADGFDDIKVKKCPADPLTLKAKVAAIKADMAEFGAGRLNRLPVLVNLLPAAGDCDLSEYPDTEALLRASGTSGPPDIAYCLAAIESGVPVINFTPNAIEQPVVVEAARKNRVPIAGRDGKTGQTYFKVVLASALRARKLKVDGWYSLNILGNADGKNLMAPERAAGKLANKTDLLDDILGYPIGLQYDGSSHKVHIDYYPPRGDAKEAWDVIDFKGLFDMPMSMRLNLQGRDSILAAPMVLDLARWAAALKLAGYRGLVPELGLYFKKPVGDNPPLTFQAQLESLERLSRWIEEQAPE